MHSIVAIDIPVAVHFPRPAPPVYARRATYMIRQKLLLCTFYYAVTTTASFVLCIRHIVGSPRACAVAVPIAYVQKTNALDAGAPVQEIRKGRSGGIVRGRDLNQEVRGEA